MTRDDESFDDEWTAGERAALEALSRERIPPADLKTRTTQLLRDRTLIGGIPRGRFTARLGVAIAVAATLVFAAGAIVGYAAAQRRSVTEPVAGIAARRAVARSETVSTVTPTASPGTTPPAVRQVVWF